MIKYGLSKAIVKGKVKDNNSIREMEISLEKGKKSLNINKPKIKKCYNCMETCNPSSTPYCISQALINAVNGDIDNALLFCGAEAYKINKIKTVKKVIDELISEI